MGLSWWKGFRVLVNWIFSCVFVYIVEFDILFEYLKKKIKGLLYVYINYVVVFFRSMYVYKCRKIWYFIWIVVKNERFIVFIY